MNHDLDTFIVITPIDKPEFVIRPAFVHELNASHDKEPAKIFCTTREGASAESIISDKEYTRLKKIFTGK